MASRIYVLRLCNVTDEIGAEKTRKDSVLLTLRKMAMKLIQELLGNILTVLGGC